MTEIKDKSLKVSKVIYYNKDCKWGVLGCIPQNDLDGLEDLINDFGNITISGNFEGVYEGAEIIVSGDIVNNPKYGKQIGIKGLQVVQDTKTKEGVVSFLSKSSIAGINTKNAVKIYEYFGSSAIDIVLNHPERIKEIKGISTKTYERVLSSVAKYKKSKELIDFCTSIGMSYSTIMKIEEVFGKNSLSKIKENPFEIVQKVKGVSFKQMDDIFINNGGSYNDHRRLSCALLKSVEDIAILEGSTGCSYTKAYNKYKSMLTFPQGALDLFDETLNALSLAGKVITEYTPNKTIFYKEYTDIEKNIASSLKILEKEGYSLLDNRLKEAKNIIAEEMKNFPFTLNEQQIKAIKDILKHRVAVLTGGGGVGKTSITKALYNIYTRVGFNVSLLAPTAKACRRLEECIPNSEASTIHKFLLTQSEGLPLDSVLIIDEASMLDILLLNDLLDLIDPSSRIIFVGDNNQLPSVQAGNVLGDLIDSKAVHISLLTDVTRQKEDSHIIEYCTMINEGNIIKPCEFSDFHYEEFGDASELKNFLFEKYIDEVIKNGLSEVQVIAPYKKGEIGMSNLNVLLQNAYQNEYLGGFCIAPYRIGDRVRHTINNYNKDVYNGEVGIVESFDEEDEVLTVDYGTKKVTYTEDELEELTLSYASTVHSSQGSEYKVVFVVLDDTAINDFLLIRRLLYTAVSRGKEKVYILTKPYLVDKCISNNSYRPRITKLCEYLELKN